jgi:hypothetical protein
MYLKQGDGGLFPGLLIVSAILGADWLELLTRPQTKANILIQRQPVPKN